MISKQQLGLTDYSVLLISLIIPACTGLYIRLKKKQSNSLDNYLLAGKNASMVPVVMSISVTVMSAILMLGFPAEMYKFGSQYTLVAFSTVVGMLLSSRVFLPVYFQCKVTSIYEFLEMRFGKLTRYSISAIFIIENVLYMSTVLLGPVLALSAVTDFSIEAAIIICGSVCTFYCVLGGLKAVMWTDVFQAALMFLAIIIMFITAIGEVGSVGEIYDRVKKGERLEFFDFRFDFETRYTFWNSLLRGLVFGLTYYGTSQIEVQRSLSMSGCKRAQTALQWSTLPVAALEISCCLLGLLIYAVFYLCDPVLNHEKTGINNYDQIVPYFIITRLQSIPGLTGLCIAGIFSGSLSTMSSAINSLATVAIVDFIQPNFPTLVTEKRLVFFAKALGVMFGVTCIGLTFTFARLKSIIQTTAVLNSSGEGPVLAVFLIGVLTRKATDKCSFFGLLAGLAVVNVIGYCTLYGGYLPPVLPLETSGCLDYNNTAQQIEELANLCSDIHQCENKNTTSDASENIFGLFKMPFNLIAIIGFSVTVFSTFIASFLLDRFKDVIPSDSMCLSPVVKTRKSRAPKTVLIEEQFELTTNER